MSAKLLAGMAVMVGAPTMVHAEPRAVFADIAQGAPFDATQLAMAIRLRVPPTGAPIRIRISAAPGALRVEARGSAREVALGGLSGAAAARLVALVVDDLLLDDLSSLPPPAAGSERARPSIGVLGGAAVWQHPLGGLGLDIAIPRGAWLIALEASGSTLVDGPIRLTAATARVGGGLRVEPFDLRAGATFVPVVVSDGVHDRTILVGAGASVRLRIPFTDTVRGVLAGGVDVFATRTTYVLDGVTLMTTPRSAPWIGTGLEIAL